MLLTIKSNLFLDFIGTGVLAGYSFGVVLFELNVIEFPTSNDDGLLRR